MTPVAVERGNTGDAIVRSAAMLGMIGLDYLLGYTFVLRFMDILKNRFSEPEKSVPGVAGKA